MALDEFFALLEPMRGQFFMWPDGRIRHKCKVDGRSDSCCPITALYGGVNIHAVAIAIKAGMCQSDAAAITDAADDEYDHYADVRRRLLDLCTS